MNDTPRIRYPLPCGCAGPLYVSMCELHQQEERDRTLAHLTAMQNLSAPPHCPTCQCEKLR